MTKISLELDAGLNKRLKQYALDHYDIPHGKQQMIIRGALIAFLDANEGKKQPEVIEIQPESTSEEIVEECKPEPAAATKPTRKPGKAKKGTKGRITAADLAYIKAQRLAGKGWSEIGRGMNPKRSASTVRSAAERMIKAGELKEETETEPETANVGE